MEHHWFALLAETLSHRYLRGLDTQKLFLIIESLFQEYLVRAGQNQIHEF